MAVEFDLLGEVTVRVDGCAVVLGPPKQRCLLAALAVDLGQLVPAHRLVERIWGVNVPRRGRAVLHSYVSRLRRVLIDAETVDIVHRSGGYALMVNQTDQAVDLRRFNELCSRARGETDDAQTVRLLTQALELWRGEALTGLTGDWVETERDRLRQERLAVEHDLVDARLRAGQGEELVADLSARTAQHPLDERVAGQYMLALYRAGRSADALGHYRQLRERLVEALGIDPSAAIQDLHRRILAADLGLVTTRACTVTEPVVPPRQLPAAPALFVGRHHEQNRLDAALPDISRPASTAAIFAIAGAGGIGKTWLALHWAQQHIDRYPDGQLFVDLHGFSPDSTPMQPAVAMRGFLDALGVEPDRIPIDLHAQAALFRSLVADKRLLLVLDNAADTSQVTPLLPGSVTCTVVVTSRNRLPGLIAGHAAHHLSLDVLSDIDARALLSKRLSPARVAAELAAVQELIKLCGGFPLALGIIAGRAQTHPCIPLADFVIELRDLGLEALNDDDPAASLPTVLSWSHRSLTPEQQTAFGLLGIAPGPDIALSAAANLIGAPRARAGHTLRELEGESLLTRDSRGRYRMHDLIRDYATITAHQQLPEETRKAALRRVVDFYLHTAYTAECQLDTHHQPLRLTPPAPGTRPDQLTDDPSALAWLNVEHPNLLAAQHTAATHQWHQVVWQMAWGLLTFHARRGHREADLTTWRAAVDAAAHLSDRTAHTITHRLLGRAYAELGQHEVAIRHLHQALTLAEHHDPTQHASTHQQLAFAWERRGDNQQALQHATHARDLYRMLDQSAREARALSQMGCYAAHLGEYDIAYAHCQTALTLHRRHHDPTGEALTLKSLGYIDHHTDHYDEAIDHYTQALTLFRNLGSTYYSANTLDNLGHPYAVLGQHEQALTAWQEALQLYRNQGRHQDAERIQKQLDALDNIDCDELTQSTK